MTIIVNASRHRSCRPFAVMVAALALGAASCGDGPADDANERAAGTGRPAAEVKVPSHSAEAAVLHVWRLYQDSTWPSIVGAYDPKVVDTLGAGDMMNALSLYAGDLQEAPVLTIASYESTLGSVVSMTLRYSGKPYKVAYVMRKSSANGEWRIVYDTLLANALSNYVESEAKALSGEPASQPSSPRVSRAAATAQRIYRDIFLEEAGQYRLFRRVMSDSRDQTVGQDATGVGR